MKNTETAHLAAACSALPSRAAMVLVGDEILSGKVQDVNGPLLATRLREKGVELRRILTVRDEPAEIAWAVQMVKGNHDHVFTSGGIGPTHDDVTVEGVARALGVGVTLHPHLEGLLRERKGARITPAHLRMAMVPDGARLHSGGQIQFPLLQVENIFILPGVPSAFDAKLAIALQLMESATPLRSTNLDLEVDEGLLAPHLEETLRAFPGVAIGSYPSWDGGRYRVRICLESRDDQSLDAACAHLQAALGNRRSS